MVIDNGRIVTCNSVFSLMKTDGDLSIGGCLDGSEHK